MTGRLIKKASTGRQTAQTSSTATSKCERVATDEVGKEIDDTFHLAVASPQSKSVCDRAKRFSKYVICATIWILHRPDGLRQVSHAPVRPTGGDPVGGRH
jgi:hypothetical protein